MNNESIYVSDRQLAARYNISRATVWRWAKAGNLPRPHELSPGCTRWQIDEVEARDAEREQASAA